MRALVLLFLGLVALKLFGIITWPWWLVALPLLAPAAWVLVVLIVSLIFYL
jgi:hypothetical protein